MQGDTGELYRQVDSKYIHNLDLKALGLRAGLYRVFITIDGQTHEAGSGSFSLKQSTGGPLQWRGGPAPPASSSGRHIPVHLGSTPAAVAATSSEAHPCSTVRC